MADTVSSSTLRYATAFVAGGLTFYAGQQAAEHIDRRTSNATCSIAIYEAAIKRAVDADDTAALKHAAAYGHITTNEQRVENEIAAVVRAIYVLLDARRADAGFYTQPIGDTLHTHIVQLAMSFVRRPTAFGIGGHMRNGDRIVLSPEIGMGEDDQFVAEVLKAKTLPMMREFNARQTTWRWIRSWFAWQ